MIVVASVRESRVQNLRSPTRHSNLLDPPVSVEDQILAVRHPVGRLESLWRNVNRAPVRGGDCDDFERTVQRGRFGNGCRLRRLQFDIGEHRLFHHLFIVAAHANAHVKRLFQRDTRGPARQMEFTLLIREPH